MYQGAELVFGESLFWCRTLIGYVERRGVVHIIVLDWRK
jgi:hypothetical protein